MTIKGQNLGCFITDLRSARHIVKLVKKMNPQGPLPTLIISDQAMDTIHKDKYANIPVVGLSIWIDGVWLACQASARHP